MRRPRLFLDANVLVAARVRDLLLRIAEAGIVDIRWSRYVLDETRRALISRLAVNPEDADRLINHMTAAFPDALVEEFEWRMDALELPDSDDRHVLAAAIHGECDEIVTNNTKDFPQSVLASYDLSVMDSDMCLVWLAQFAEPVAPILDQQIADLRRPPSTVVDFLEQLRRDAPHGAVVLGAVLRHDRYRAMLPDLLDAVEPASPQSAVHQLLAMVRDDSAPPELLDQIDPDFARRSEVDLAWKRESIHNALRTELADVLEAWDNFGIGSAKRTVDLDVEIVPLFRRSPGRALHTGNVHRLLVMRFRDGDWRLVAVDHPSTGDQEVFE